MYSIPAEAISFANLMKRCLAQESSAVDDSYEMVCVTSNRLGLLMSSMQRKLLAETGQATKDMVAIGGLRYVTFGLGDNED